MKRPNSQHVRWSNLSVWALRTAMASLWFYQRKKRPLSWQRLSSNVRPNLHRPIFIVGAERSGTTFLGSSLGVMQGISYHHEPVLTKASARYVQDGRWSQPQAARLYRSTYRWLMRLHLDGDLRFVEKTPHNCYLVPFLASAFPDAQFLHIVRDGRDAALSLSLQPWLRRAYSYSGAIEPGGEPYGAWRRFWVEPERILEFESTSDIRRCAWAWRRHTETACRALSELPADRRLEVRYESLVGNPSIEGERILGFLGIEDQVDRDLFLCALQHASPDSVARWRKELTDEQIAEIEAETGPLLRQLGYSFQGPVLRNHRSHSPEGKRLLMIAPYPVLPPVTGGKIRIVRLAEELARSGISVTVLTPFKPGQSGYQRTMPFELRQVMYPFFLPLLATDRPFPFQYLVSFHPGYARHLRAWFATFDIYQFEHVAFADLISALPQGRPVIYDAHNIEYDYVRDECSWPPVRSLVGWRTLHLEKRLAVHVDGVMVCSEEERSRLAQLYRLDVSKIRVVANGIRPPDPAADGLSGEGDEWPLPGLSAYERVALFSGSDVAHNRRAVRWIIERLAPRVSKVCAIVLHGSCGLRFASETGPGGNVFFDPDLSSFQRYIRPGVVAINPVVTGAGTNLKLVNAMAHGLPVLSTRFGARGYDDLLPYMCIRPLKSFATTLRNGGLPEAPPLEALRPYFWSELAKKAARCYSSPSREIG